MSGMSTIYTAQVLSVLYYRLYSDKHTAVCACLKLTRYQFLAKRDVMRFFKLNNWVTARRSKFHGGGGV